MATTKKNGDASAGSEQPAGVEITHDQLGAIDKEFSGAAADHTTAATSGKLQAADTKAAHGLDLSKFPGLYAKTIRGALVAAGGLLKLLHRGDIANAIGQAVAFLDLATGYTPGA